MLELCGVALKAGARPINHQFPSGGITVVLGRNHSGKTLLCRVLAGLAEPAAGELKLDGQSLSGVSPGARPVALVYQAFVNYPNWTVRENIASPMLAALKSGAGSLDRAGIDVEVREIATKLGLGELLDRYPDALSGGQQQRLAIGRALAKRARVLVMDEPLVNLDYKLRESLQLELGLLLRELDLTVIYTSSDPRDAFALGDSLLLMANDEVLQAGAPLAVFEAPATPAAADLMSDPRANRLADDSGALVRPEHLYLTRHEGTDHAFTVTVIGSETNGSETFVHCRPDGMTEDDHWVARLDGLISLSAGSRPTLFAPAENIHRFPAGETAQEQALG